MNLKEDIKPISYIKTNAADMLNYINENKNPIIITQNGEARGVFLDIESYQNMLNAIALLKIIQISEKEISNGEVSKVEDVFDELYKKIEQQ
ncbi:MAG: type II toxin-antitoxin system Phd/YefM family antitoxin [Fibrobacter sp.]|nr:type II toxin-antitoxin system Phd/YefM family antitoxin [Fibrobacter sp.]